MDVNTMTVPCAPAQKTVWSVMEEVQRSIGFLEESIRNLDNCILPTHAISKSDKEIEESQDGILAQLIYILCRVQSMSEQVYIIQDYVGSPS